MDLSKDKWFKMEDQTPDEHRLFYGRDTFVCFDENELHADAFTATWEGVNEYYLAGWGSHEEGLALKKEDVTHWMLPSLPE